MNTVDGSEIPNTWDEKIKTLYLNDGTFYISSTGEFAGFLNHQRSYHVWPQHLQSIATEDAKIPKVLVENPLFLEGNYCTLPETNIVPEN